MDSRVIEYVFCVMNFEFLIFVLFFSLIVFIRFWKNGLKRKVNSLSEISIFEY